MDHTNRSVSPRAPRRLGRRDLLKLGAAGATGLAGAALSGSLPGRLVQAENQPAAGTHSGHKASFPGAGLHMPQPGGGYGPDGPLGMNPNRFLRDFYWGGVFGRENGRTVRTYRMIASERNVEVAPGLMMAAWLYNHQMPGPTIRANEGDLLRIEFINASSHPHTVHFHGIHPANMDGVLEPVLPGDTYTYEFIARPFGVHLYHCHVMPLDKHIAKGLFGMFIVDPPGGWPRADHELVMVMHGLDVDSDGENELYAVNGVAFYHRDFPIPVRVGETIRLFLGNMTEFDLLNSFHLHGDMFRYYPTGTRPDQYFYSDTVMQCQGERGILEFSFSHPGMFMFHAHQTEFTQLGWVGFFDVKES